MEQDVARYDRSDPAIEQRVAGLLERMTLDEKVGQLVQIMPFQPFDPLEADAQRKRAEDAGEPFEFVPQVRPDLEDLIRAGKIGSIFGSYDAGLVNRCQRVAVEESRLGIPLIVGNDVIHGCRTIFPIPLAESCTWHPALLQRAARAAAEEASWLGTDWIFAPMVDISRDPRWGRIAESAGEDPYLGMAMAQARVRGFQAADLSSGRHIAACPKHYVAYGAAEAGRDYNSVDISERALREVYLPPFKAAFEAGADSVMTSFNDISGIPATANPFTLRSVLRDEWQWAGVAVSDYEAIRELIPHGVASDLKDAARQSILAGLDMDMMSNAYAGHLAELVKDGTVPEGVVDEAVRRVLRLKIALGLFDRPYVDEALADRLMLREDFRELALEVARESMVLLKNERDILPLRTGARVALIGPLADNRRDLLGTWVIHGRAEDVETVREGLSAYLDGDNAPEYEQGCQISGDGPPDLSSAVETARRADVVVLVLGESADMSGEAQSRAHLGLPGRQEELFDAVAATGKPIVTVLMSGRPLVIPHLAEQTDALLAAWHGGIRAGKAVADLLFGSVTPSGKLTATWPRAAGQIPIYYAHKNTGRPPESEGTTQFVEAFKSTYRDEPNSPLFPFGFGLSYTTFIYRDLLIEQPVVARDGTLAVAATIENTGAFAGDEIVQLYIHDVVASVTRPVKELKGFQRVSLQPGETRTVCFEVPVSDLGFIGQEMRYVVEPGAFKVWVGPNSSEGLEGDFAVQ